MTVDEFKKQYPEQAHLEGSELWDAMTAALFKQQQGNSIITKTLPFYKRYKLRYLFYRHKPNLVFGKNDYASSKRCTQCKKGTGGLRIVWIGMSKDEISSPCPHCCKQLVEEENTNLNHKLYCIWRFIKEGTFVILDKLHILRNTIEGRYDMFGDESHYVKSTEYNKDWEFVRRTFYTRKWYEYIFIKKR